MTRTKKKFDLEKSIIKELENIYINGPLSPGDTISHGTAEECVNRGWARKTSDDCFHITVEGQERLAFHKASENA